MPALNRVMIIGNVTRDGELRYTPNGVAVLTLGLAVDRAFGPGTERKVETTFLEVELWGRTAEVAAAYARRGRAVFIEGRLAVEAWEDKGSGQRRSRLKVVGESMQLLGGRPEGAQDGEGEKQAIRCGAKPAPLDAGEDDEIPF